MPKQRFIAHFLIVVGILSAGGAGGVAQTQEVGQPAVWESYTASGAEWFPAGEYQQVTLIVVGPNGERPAYFSTGRIGAV